VQQSTCHVGSCRSSPSGLHRTLPVSLAEDASESHRVHRVHRVRVETRTNCHENQIQRSAPESAELPSEQRDRESSEYRADEYGRPVLGYEHGGPVKADNACCVAALEVLPRSQSRHLRSLQCRRSEHRRHLEMTLAYGRDSRRLAARRAGRSDRTKRRIEISAAASLSDSASIADARLSEANRCAPVDHWTGNRNYFRFP
jgi:hypothetical protein